MQIFGGGVGDGRVFLSRSVFGTKEVMPTNARQESMTDETQAADEALSAHALCERMRAADGVIAIVPEHAQDGWR